EPAYPGNTFGRNGKGEGRRGKRKRNSAETNPGPPLRRAQSGLPRAQVGCRQTGKVASGRLRWSWTAATVIHQLENSFACKGPQADNFRCLPTFVWKSE